MTVSITALIGPKALHLRHVSESEFSVLSLSPRCAADCHQGEKKNTETIRAAFASRPGRARITIVRISACRREPACETAGSRAHR